MDGVDSMDDDDEDEDEDGCDDDEDGDWMCWLSSSSSSWRRRMMEQFVRRQSLESRLLDHDRRVRHDHYRRRSLHQKYLVESYRREGW